MRRLFEDMFSSDITLIKDSLHYLQKYNSVIEKVISSEIEDLSPTEEETS